MLPGVRCADPACLFVPRTSGPRLGDQGRGMFSFRGSFGQDPASSDVSDDGVHNASYRQRQLLHRRPMSGVRQRPWTDSLHLGGIDVPQTAPPPGLGPTEPGCWWRKRGPKGGALQQVAGGNGVAEHLRMVSGQVSCLRRPGQGSRTGVVPGGIQLAGGREAALCLATPPALPSRGSTSPRTSVAPRPTGWPGPPSTGEHPLRMSSDVQRGPPCCKTNRWKTSGFEFQSRTSCAVVNGEHPTHKAHAEGGLLRSIALGLPRRTYPRRR